MTGRQHDLPSKCLYCGKALREGFDYCHEECEWRADERASIVDWLRAVEKSPRARMELPAGDTVKHVADAIERGDHAE